METIVVMAAEIILVCVELKRDAVLEHGLPGSDRFLISAFVRKRVIKCFHY